MSTLILQLESILGTLRPDVDANDEKLKRHFAAVILKESEYGAEEKVGWTYYNRVVVQKRGFAGLKASTPYQRLDIPDGDWLKVWLVTLGDMTYAKQKSTEKDVRDFATIGDFVAQHRWFNDNPHGKARAAKWRNILTDLHGKAATNPYPGWTGQGSHNDFNSNKIAWFRMARAYYWLQQSDSALPRLVELTTASVIFHGDAIAKYFAKNPQKLSPDVRPYP